jgi:hypothetical protein
MWGKKKGSALGNRQYDPNRPVTPQPPRDEIHALEIRYVEDGNIKSTVIDPWLTTLNRGEFNLWSLIANTKGIIRKKIIESFVVTNFRLMIIDHENNRLTMLILIPNLDDVVVMNTHRVSDSVGYAL